MSVLGKINFGKIAKLILAAPAAIEAAGAIVTAARPIVVAIGAVIKGKKEPTA